MRSRKYKLVGRVLAFLLFCLSLSPLSGRAEAQMRCAGAPQSAAPCEQVELPATGLTEAQVATRMARMPCCRARQGRMRNCPSQHSVQKSVQPHSPPHLMNAPTAERMATPHCLMTVRVIASGTSTPPAAHPHWFLTANPALAPLAPVCFVPAASAPAFLAQPSALSPPAPPQSHGLRAPPAA